MTRAISRDSFNELKQYLGVHLQQGRVILDSDWNEGQDIMANLARRLGQDAFGDGVLDEGFEILPVIPPGEQGPNELVYFQAGLPLLFRFPLAAPFDAFESLDGWALSGPGKLRLSKDRPYEGTSFLRVSDHTGRVELARTLPAPADLSAFQFAHFRLRLNQAVPRPAPDTAAFFIEDASGKRNVYPVNAVSSADDMWTPSAAMPLDLHFDIFDFELGPAVRNRAYRTSFMPVGASSSVSWAVTAGALPPGLTLIPFALNPKYAQLDGTPTQSGPFSFTLTATMGATSRSRAFTLRVQEPPAVPLSTITADNSALSWDGFLQQITTPSGTPADLTQIKKYGFQIFQQSPAPLVWDFDALYLGSRDMIKQAAANNFIISGPQQRQVLDLLQSQAAVFGIPNITGGPELLNGLLQRTFQGIPRAYAGGLACTQTRDLLYSEQADPDDPPLLPSGPDDGHRGMLIAGHQHWEGVQSSPVMAIGFAGSRQTSDGHRASARGAPRSPMATIG